jgi:hypothetical protein
LAEGVGIVAWSSIRAARLSPKYATFLKWMAAWVIMMMIVYFLFRPLP